MSIEIKNKAKKKDKSKSILIGKTSNNYIYYNGNVPKKDRVREIEMEESIDIVPYLDKNNKQRSASFISGISGSGKSTLAVKLINHLREIDGNTKNKQTGLMEPKKVIIFSSSQLANKDPAFEKLQNYAYVPLDHPEFPLISLDDLKNTICVFDDYENLADRKLEAYVLFFIKDLLERSRKLNVGIIIINHLTQNFNKTRSIIAECTDYYLNVSSNRNSTMRFLKSYFDFSPKELAEIKNYEFENPFTWCLFRKSLPSYSIIENKIKLL